MSNIELIAVLLGLISVGLTVRQHIACFPVGIVMVILYAYVFWGAKLYSDMLLQIIYVILQVWGWYQWTKGSNNNALPVSWLNNPQRAGSAVIIATTTLLLGTFMHRQTDAALPYIDASTTAISLAAQGMMTYKKIDNWILWIIADIIYVFVYIERNLPLTAALYAVFLVMAGIGLWTWQREAANLRQPIA